MLNFIKKKTKNLSAVVQLGCRSVRVEKAKADRKGFTVLEMVIVAGILTMLFAVVITNFRGFENKSLLDSQTEELVSVLRQAQVLSLTGQTIGGTRYNYGVHFEECASGSCSYILFVDLDSDNVYDSSPNEQHSQGQVSFLEGVYVDSVDPGTVDNKLDIVFEVPLSDIYFNNSQTQDEATIIIKHAVFSGQSIITINRTSGQIDVN